MYYPVIKQKVISLRESGKSLQEIAHITHMNKSTISYWCRDVRLSETALKRIRYDGNTKSMQGLLRYSEKKRSERIKRTRTEKQQGAELVGVLSKRDIFMIGLGLYWGEGYKESNGELGFTNSNSGIITFYIKWLQSLGVSKDDLIFRLTINNLFKKEEKNIKSFWVNKLNVREDQFSKTTTIKTNLKKASIKNKENYKGILRVKVRRGLALKNKILGAIDYISNIS